MVRLLPLLIAFVLLSPPLALKERAAFFCLLFFFALPVSLWSGCMLL
jgi:hypothetical protein